MAPGDAVTVTRIHRLARSTFDLFGIVKRIVDASQFRSLAEPWADTGTGTGRLMLAVLGGLADVERDPYPHPYRRRQEPRQGPRRAHGAAPRASCAVRMRMPRPTRNHPQDIATNMAIPIQMMKMARAIESRCRVSSLFSVDDP
jgi:DNA invertase Pin-like site-specific DNA recombinase